VQQSNEKERLFVVADLCGGMAPLLCMCRGGSPRSTILAKHLAEVDVSRPLPPGDLQKMQGRALANALRVALGPAREGPGAIARQAAQMPRRKADLNDNADRDHRGTEQNKRGRVEARMDERAGHGLTPDESPSAGARKATAAKAVANLTLVDVREADRGASGVFGLDFVLGGSGRGVMPLRLLRNGVFHALGIHLAGLPFPATQAEIGHEVIWGLEGSRVQAPSGV
jgi:hypothetical protein